MFTGRIGGQVELPSSERLHLEMHFIFLKKERQGSRVTGRADYSSGGVGDDAKLIVFVYTWLVPPRQKPGDEP